MFSSKAPLYLVPLTKLLTSSAKILLFLSFSGTCPLLILSAKPSAIAVLPTPGSPSNRGLFLDFLDKISITLSISSSLPITGFNLFSSASLDKSVPKLEISVWFWSLDSVLLESFKDEPIKLLINSDFELKQIWLKSFTSTFAIAYLKIEFKCFEISGPKLILFGLTFSDLFGINSKAFFKIESPSKPLLDKNILNSEFSDFNNAINKWSTVVWLEVLFFEISNASKIICFALGVNLEKNLAWEFVRELLLLKKSL